MDFVNYNDFIKAFLIEDIETMNEYMNRVSLSMFSSFDGGNKPLEATSPERFYHGFVLGLLVDLSGRYVVTSNRESGFGRYDVLLRPLNKEDDRERAYPQIWFCICGKESVDWVVYIHTGDADKRKLLSYSSILEQ